MTQHDQATNTHHGPETSLVLDIGGDLGALVIHAGRDWAETEIEISPGPPDPATPRSHNVVHARQNRHGTQYSAVFPQLSAGTYTIWRDTMTADRVITIHGGHVTEYHLDQE